MTQLPPRAAARRLANRMAPMVELAKSTSETVPGIAAALGATGRLSPGGLMAHLQHMRHERSQADADNLAQSFHRDDRRQVRKFAATSAAHADVTRQFPFLAYVLACRLGNLDRRLAAEAAMSQGETLTRITRAAGVPIWTRGLPPAACTDPKGTLPDGAAFSRAIGDVLRQHADHGRELRGITRTIAFAHAAASEEFALWLATRLLAFCQNDPQPGPIRMLALWCLFSKCPPCLGRELILKPWTRDMGLETAFHAMRNFNRRIDLEVLVGPRGLDDPWYQRQSFKGHDFVPLVTSIEIRAEARRNQNCLDLYGQRLATNRSRLWSIRDAEGTCVANIEVCSSPTRPTAPCIIQIKAPNNQTASPLVTGMAQLWLRQQVRTHGAPDMRPRAAAAPDAARWRDIMAPLAAAGTLPVWARACPTNDDILVMDYELMSFAASIPTKGWRTA